jgi:hypothetical protein
VVCKRARGNENNPACGFLPDVFKDCFGIVFSRIKLLDDLKLQSFRSGESCEKGLPVRIAPYQDTSLPENALIVMMDQVFFS